MTDTDELRQQVSRRYGAAARQVLDAQPASCCGPSATALVEEKGPLGEIYEAHESAAVPEGAVAASLGCGNPTALADLHEGEVVLDLGSGGGIDVLLSAKRVGPTGKAYGLDMTAEMLELARRNQAESGVDNAEFLEGHIEDVPLPDATVDVVISNCVINLSGNKERVFQEAFRVLRPGGRFAVSDLVVQGELDPEIRSSFELWASCVAGALTEDEYRNGLEKAGFSDVEIQVTRTFGPDDAAAFLAGTDVDPARYDPERGTLVSAFVRAVKPV